MTGTRSAGEVAAVGPEVTRVRPGDEVYGVGAGAFADFVCASTDRLAPKSANLSFDEAAGVPTAGSTALIGLRDKAGSRPGSPSSSSARRPS